MEYLNPKQGKTTRKLKCDRCGGTWYESKAITACEFLLDSEGTIISMAEKPSNMDRLPSYYRCIGCDKLVKDNRKYL